MTAQQFGRRRPSPHRRPSGESRRPLLRIRRIRRRASAGFTLLELIVVLTILGAAMALALPNLQNLYDSLVRRSERDLVLDEVNRLGATAASVGRDLVLWPEDEELPADEDARLRKASPDAVRHELELPPNWRLELDRPLLVRANGVCLGARLTLVDAEGRREAFRLQAPFCRVA